MTSAPYYFPISQSELRHYVERLLRDLPLPLYLYNMPETTKVQFTPETVRSLMQQDQIIGMKDSSGDLEYFRRLIAIAARERPDWRIFTGSEHLLAESVRMGGHGGVNGGAMIDPALLVELYSAAKNGNASHLAQLKERLKELGKVYAVGRISPTIIRRMKCALSLMGLCSDMMVAPLMPCSSQERAEIRSTLQELGINQAVLAK